MAFLDANTGLEGHLMNAISSGNRNTVRALPEAGDNVNSSDAQGVTPVILAATQWSRGGAGNSRLLLGAGAEANAEWDSDGANVQMHASEGNNEALQAMMGKMAVVDIRPLCRAADDPEGMPRYCVL